MSEILKYDLTKSKLALISKQNPLLAELVPDFRSQMIFETEFDESYPRLPTDKDSTRILISYTNLRGHSQIYSVLDDNRLSTSSTLDIDDFINKFDMSLEDKDSPNNPAMRFNFILTILISSTITSILDLGDTPDSKFLKSKNELILKALIACVYQDPLDVMILVKDTLDEESGISYPKITKIWRIKSR